MAEINENNPVSNDDQSNLLTSAEMTEKKKSKEQTNLYLEDGEKRIDCIIAYEVDPNDEDASKLQNFRDTYLENLSKKGLIIEKADSAKPKDEYGTFEENKKQDAEMFYLKVHAPFEVLCDTAEDMKMKMPIRENDIIIRPWYETFLGIYDTVKKLDPFELRDSATKPGKNYFVAHFDKDHLKDYIGHEDPDTFFTSAERSRLVYYVLEKTKFGERELDLGVFNLIHRNVILDAYPLHSGPPREDSSDPVTNDRQALQADWASIKRMFKYQPIPSIKNYFGEKIALYFAWLGFYTAFLIPAAIVGILCFVYGVGSSTSYTPIKELCEPPKNNATYRQFYMCPLCDQLCSYYLLEEAGCTYAKVNHFFDNQATLFFAMFMSIWATIFLEFWKRKQVSLAYEWHTMDFEEEEERPRPEYLATVTRLRVNPVTTKMEPYMPTGQRCQRLFGAFGTVLFFVILVLAAVVSVIVFRAAFYAFLIGQDNATIRQRSKIVVSICAACINLIAINLLKQIYQRIAVKITDWENPRTRTDYEDSFTVKMFWFQFSNTYASIFYVAFFKSEFFTGSPGKYKRFGEKRFRFDGCAVQGCFLELTVQLIIIMVGQQVIGNIMEIVIPYIKNKIRDYQNRNRNQYTNADEPQWVTDFEGEMQTKFSLFWQYLEIVLQYGFVTMFVAAFPLAPLFALFNNMVEIRLDAVNFIHNFRRPFAQRAEDIGAWYGILATLTTFSTLVNSFVLAYTSELIPHLVYEYYGSPDGSLKGFTEWSLSYFPTNNFANASRPDNANLNTAFNQSYCRYPGYHEIGSPFKRNTKYWVITAARLAFILVFQAFVVVIMWVIGYVIPDIPKNLELKIKREQYIASEMSKDYKEQSGKRKPRPGEAPNNFSINQQHTTYI